VRDKSGRLLNGPSAFLGYKLPAPPSSIEGEPALAGAGGLDSRDSLGVIVRLTRPHPE